MEKIKKINLNSLVVCIGPKTFNKMKNILNKFQENEIISMDKCYEHLFKKKYSLFGKEDVTQYYYDNIEYKIKNGFRAVVVNSSLIKEERIKYIEISKKYDVQLYYVIFYDKNNIDNENNDWLKKQNEIFEKNEKQIIQGDFIADVIDTRKTDFVVVNYNEDENLLNLKTIENYSGITVIPDVHNMKESLSNAIDWAKTMNRYMICLGDFIDYGHSPIETIELIYNEVKKGTMSVIYGNHENKISRWMLGKSVQLNDGNKVTVEQLKDLKDINRIKIETKWKMISLNSTNYLTYNNITFTHGAIHPSFWKNTWKYEKNFIKYCLFGEVNEYKNDTYPLRSYEWCKYVPENNIVFVGHDIRNTDIPHKEVNNQGGITIFLDCGCGKGGTLHTADLIFDKNNKSKIERIYYNRH